MIYKTKFDVIKTRTLQVILLRFTKVQIGSDNQEFFYQFKQYLANCQKGTYKVFPSLRHRNVSRLVINL